MIPAILFILVIASSGMTGYFYKYFVTRKTSQSQTFLFLGLFSLPLACLFGVISAVQGAAFSASTVITGVLGGVCSFSASFALLKSMDIGSYTVSIIIINLNFVVPIALSWIFLKEAANAFQIAGILLLCAIIVFVNLKRPVGKKVDSPAEKAERLGDPAQVADLSESTAEAAVSVEADGGADCESAQDRKKKGSAVWIVFALLACFANGLFNFAVKVQQHYTPGAGQNGFFFCSYGTVFLISAVLFLFRRRSLKNEFSAKNILFPALGLGLCLVLCQYPQSLLPTYVNASMQFGIGAGGALLFSLIIGWIVYKEKLLKKDLISLLCGVLAIVLQVL